MAHMQYKVFGMRPSGAVTNTGRDTISCGCIEFDSVSDPLQYLARCQVESHGQTSDVAPASVASASMAPSECHHQDGSRTHCICFSLCYDCLQTFASDRSPQHRTVHEQRGGQWRL